MNVAIDEINENSSPDTVKNWDSLQHMNLILALEEEFKISFSDKEIVEMLSVGIIIETLKERHMDLLAPPFHIS